MNGKMTGVYRFLALQEERIMKRISDAANYTLNHQQLHHQELSLLMSLIKKTTFSDKDDSDSGSSREMPFKSEVGPLTPKY